MISGASLAVQRLAEGMAARDHVVLVMTASERGEAYTEEFDNLKVRRLRAFQNPLRVDQSFLLWDRNIISAEFKEFKPQILHLHDPLNLGVAGLVTARRLQIPVALTLHQVPRFVSAYLPNVPALQNTVESGLWSYGSWLLQQCEKVIVPSHAIAEEIHSHDIQRPNVISNGIDLHTFNPDPPDPSERETLWLRYGLDPDLPVILHVGRLDVDKQVNLVIRASAQAINQVDAQLLIVGDGRQREELIELCANLGIGRFCHFPGFVETNGDLPGLYRLAAVFVTASEIETQGLVILEAMASGLPVVAIKATCIPELVQDNVNGYLSQPGEVGQMSEQVLRILMSPNRAKEMGRVSRALAQEHSIDKSIDNHEELYQSIHINST
jgi:glycosyltransferase involved in cell wall biosynthesis